MPDTKGRQGEESQVPSNGQTDSEPRPQGDLPPLGHLCSGGLDPPDLSFLEITSRAWLYFTQGPEKQQNKAGKVRICCDG